MCQVSNMPRIAGICVTLILLRFLSLRHVSAQAESGATLPIVPYCGAPLSDRLIGGTQTQLDEFPWTALIQYRKPNGQTGFQCGGSLINLRYVLTAAHCVKAISRGWEVVGVRLGEWDLAADQDCELEYCTDAPVDIGIEKIITHEDYKTTRAHYNDIALIRLNRTVERSASVSPVCLPIEEQQRSQNVVDSNGYCAGWRTLEGDASSNIKLKIPMKIADFENCANVYGQHGVVLKDTQICATGFSQRDSCDRIGTSGSPLTKQEYSKDHHTLFNYQYGVSSLGPRSCGSKNIPEVYTNVAKYIDWIQSKME